jgi:alkyl hydroperoxide reductase subunit AhpC
MAPQREKMKKMVVLIDDATAKLYGNAQTAYAPLPHIRDAAERVARESQVIAAAGAATALRARDALFAVDPDYRGKALAYKPRLYCRAVHNCDCLRAQLPLSGRRIT